MSRPAVSRPDTVTVAAPGAAAPAPARRAAPAAVWRRAGFRAGLLLVLLPFVLFWRLWWPAAAQRRAFAYGDFTEQYYPMRAFVAYELRHGRLPLWDPFTYSGQPAAGASLYAPFYPPGLWETLFPDPLPFEVLEAEAVLHLGLAGVFTFLLVRRLTGSPGAGLLSGLAFGLGGFLTSYPALQLLVLETAAWLPGILWLTDLALERRSLRVAMLAGVALGCALLAGHPQTFLYIIYVAAPFFALRAWQRRAGWRQAALLAVAMTGTGAALSAVQWLPTLELSRLSPRAHLTYDEVAHGFAVPELQGLWRVNPGQWSPLYVGLVPGLLAVLSLWTLAEGLLEGRAPRVGHGPAPASAGAQGGRAGVGFWLVVAVLALLLSLGRNGFLYPLVYRFAPGFAMFRNQERSAFLVSFALAVLAGYGYRMLSGWVGFDRPAVGSAGREKGFEGVHGPGLPAHPVHLLLGAAMLLTFVDLFHANSGIILTDTPQGGYFAKTPALAQVQSVAPADWRMSSEGLLPGDGNGGLVFRLRDVAGNSPLHLQAYEQFLQAVPELRWWQLLNVQHILTRRPLDHGALKLVRQDGDLRLYQVFVQGQEAWISHGYEAAGDQAAALAATARPGLDPHVTTVLERPPDPAPAPAGGPEGLNLMAFEPGRVVADVQLSAAGLVVFSEIAYPGWVARASPVRTAGSGQNRQDLPAKSADTGQVLAPLRAFGLLRAVALPAGVWRIEWRYEPASLRFGALLSVVALLGVALSILTTRETHQT